MYALVYARIHLGHDHHEALQRLPLDKAQERLPRASKERPEGLYLGVGFPRLILRDGPGLRKRAHVLLQIQPRRRGPASHRTAPHPLRMAFSEHKAP